jgi:hypothetical protein
VGALSLGLKQLGCKTDQSSPSNANSKNELSYIPASVCTFMAFYDSMPGYDVSSGILVTVSFTAAHNILFTHEHDKCNIHFDFHINKGSCL